MKELKRLNEDLADLIAFYESKFEDLLSAKRKLKSEKEKDQIKSFLLESEHVLEKRIRNLDKCLQRINQKVAEVIKKMQIISALNKVD